jgi:DNA-binding transcriptional LysR family regulator
MPALIVGLVAIETEDKPRTGTRKRRTPPGEAYLHDWNDLRAFLNVARRRSMNEAADVLNTQQTTLSRRISALEAAIQRPLLKRTPRGITVTHDGTELLNVLERFEEDLTAVGQWITRGVRGQRPLPVNVACTEGLSAYWLTDFLPAMRKLNPLACYNIHTGLTTQPEKGRSFHASVQMHQPAETEQTEQIGTVHFTAMASRDYVAELGEYSAGKHPGAHRWIEFAQFRMMSGSWEGWFLSQRTEIAPFMVTNSLVTTVNAVRAGAGIGLLPNYMAITMPDLVPLRAGLKLKFPLWLKVDPKSYDTPALAAATGLVRAAIDPHLMPWFAERVEESPDWDDWRRIRETALKRI